MTAANNSKWITDPALYMKNPKAQNISNIITIE